MATDLTLRRGRAVLCGDTAAGRLPVEDAEPLRLALFGPAANVKLKIQDVSRELAKDIPDEFLDLLDLAAYVYAADQATSRGGIAAADLGQRWRRRLFFRLPVRRPDLWNDPATRGLLTDVLSFLTEDEYLLDFRPFRKDRPSFQRYFDFGTTPLAGTIDDVVMFSGGIDSLGGAVEEAVVAWVIRLAGGRPPGSVILVLFFLILHSPVVISFRHHSKRSWYTIAGSSRSPMIPDHPHLGRDATDALMRAAHCSDPVVGLTHNFYRYPARFSPQFARAAIVTFTKPGEIVLDPFMGGGTTAVEALAAGRRFVGCDINSLAVFVTRAKTTPLSRADAKELDKWVSRLAGYVNLRISNERHDGWNGYQRNLPWWLRKGLEMALDTLALLPTARQRRFARCTLLRTAQWALDCRQEVPTVQAFLNAHRENVVAMIAAAREFGRQMSAGFDCAPGTYWRHRRLLSRPAAGLDKDGRLPCGWLPPKLVLTSPPTSGCMSSITAGKSGAGEKPRPHSG